MNNLMMDTLSASRGSSSANMQPVTDVLPSSDSMTQIIMPPVSSTVFTTRVSSSLLVSSTSPPIITNPNQ